MVTKDLLTLLTEANNIRPSKAIAKLIDELTASKNDEMSIDLEIIERFHGPVYEAAMKLALKYGVKHSLKTWNPGFDEIYESYTFTFTGPKKALTALFIAYSPGDILCEQQFEAHFSEVIVDSLDPNEDLILLREHLTNALEIMRTKKWIEGAGVRWQHYQHGEIDQLYDRVRLAKDFVEDMLNPS